MCICNFVYCHNEGTNFKPSSIRDITQSFLNRTARHYHRLYFSDTSCRILFKSDKNCGKQNSFIKCFLHCTELHDTHTDYIFQTHPVEFYPNPINMWQKKNIISFIVSSKELLTSRRLLQNLQLLSDPT